MSQVIVARGLSSMPPRCAQILDGAEPVARVIGFCDLRDARGREYFGPAIPEVKPVDVYFSTALGIVPNP